MLPEYKIENTSEADLEFVFWLFEEAIAYQKRKKYNIWKNYDKDLLRNEVKKKAQYKIVINEKTALIFSVVYEDKLVWGDRDRDDAIYLHRIVVNPEFKGHRLFGIVLDWSIKHAENRNRKFVRMDTWASNENIIKYYESFGFTFMGNNKTPDSPELPIQHRGLHVALLELEIDKTKPFNINDMSFINFKTGKRVKLWEGITGTLHHSKQLTFAHVTLQKGALVLEHHHVHEQWTHVIEGELLFNINGEEKLLTAGMAAFMPSNVPHSATAVTECKVIDCFLPVREDFAALEKAVS